MDEVITYIEELLTQAAVLLCSINMESYKSLLLVGLLIINVFSISYLLSAIWGGKNTIIATPFFWLILGLFSFGFSMPLFWLTQFIGKKILGIKLARLNENYIWNALVPSIGAIIVLVFMEIVKNEMGIVIRENIELSLMIGLIILLFSLAINLYLNDRRTIILKNELNDSEKYYYKLVRLNRDIQKAINSNKEGDIKLNFDGKNYTFHKISRKFLQDWFLSKEETHRGYTEKTYIKLNDKIEVVEIYVGSHKRIVYSSMAGFMILLMLFTPSMLYMVNRLIEFVK
jgi:hypothetical protein